MTANEYNQCVEEYADRLFRFAVSKLSNSVEAQDVVQTVFERLWKRYTEVSYDAIKSYLFTSVNRACIDCFRRRNTSQHTTELLPTHDVAVSGHNYENFQLIQEMLNTLTEDQKSLILLRDYEGYSYQEISEMLGLTLSQVKTNLFRTRKKLQIFLASRVL